MNFTVYAGTAKSPNTPLTMSVIQAGLSKAKANQLARDLRRKRENNSTLIGVWNGQQFKSLY